MTEDTKGHLFEPFFTTKEPGKGTGLGLSMVHGLGSQSGGWMGIVTSAGAATSISIALPVAEPGAAVKPEPDRREIAPASRSYKILLVEDDVLVALGVTAVLEDMGHHVTRALDDAPALSLLNMGEAFDLVITDYAMPGMTGLELAHAIKASWPGLSDRAGDRLCRTADRIGARQHGPPVQAVPAGRLANSSPGILEPT